MSKKKLQFGIIHITRNFVNAAELVQITQNYRKINFKVKRERTDLRVVVWKPSYCDVNPIKMNKTVWMAVHVTILPFDMKRFNSDFMQRNIRILHPLYK